MGLYRPTVTRRDKKGHKVRRKPSVWWGLFRHPRTGDQIRQSLKTTDKNAAELALSEAIRNSHRESAGLVNPYEKHFVRPLTGHIGDWHTALIAKGTTEKHANLLRMRATAVVTGCRFKCWTDLSASRVQSFIGTLRDDDKSHQTCNFYLQAIKQFARWMVADRRAPHNPVGHLQGFNVRTDRRHDRRALSTNELRRLLTVTSAQPKRFLLDGAARSLLYRLVAETGLRAEECRSLTPQSFHFEGQHSRVTVEAAYAKNRRECEIPLRPELAARIKDWMSGLWDTDRMFRFSKDKGAAMVRADLEAAGIDYVDSSGRYADFHSLRHTFITNLARGGVHPKDAQTLARHSTINLTMDRYTHRALAEVANALSALPDLSDETEAERTRATGTYGATPDDSGCCTNVVLAPQNGGSQGLADDGGLLGKMNDVTATPPKPQTDTAQGVSDGNSRKKAGAVKEFTPKQQPATGRTRTDDLRFTKPLLCQLSYGGNMF